MKNKSCINEEYYKSEHPVCQIKTGEFIKVNVLVQLNLASKCSILGEVFFISNKANKEDEAYV